MDHRTALPCNQLSGARLSSGVARFRSSVLGTFVDASDRRLDTRRHAASHRAREEAHVTPTMITARAALLDPHRGARLCSSREVTHSSDVPPAPHREGHFAISPHRHIVLLAASAIAAMIWLARKQQGSAAQAQRQWRLTTDQSPLHIRLQVRRISTSS